VSDNLAVRLTPEALKHVRRGHPWVFDGGIGSVRGGRYGDGTGEPGDVAVMFDDRRRFVAVGLWDPGSPIRIKVLQSSGPVDVGPELWNDRLAHALAHRWALLGSADSDALRLLHGENDRMPGVVVDLYRTVAVVKLYSEAWIPHLDDLLDVLQSAVWSITGVVLRLSRRVAAGDLARAHDLVDGAVVRGSVRNERVTFSEHGLRFTADVRHGQKTGWFLDQRDNRALVGDMAEGARVLDVFCCGGGFGVHAAAGGARHVHFLDISPYAIDEAAANLELNRGVRAAGAATMVGTVGDAFEVMDELRRGRDRYDLVVVDPPSFASRQADVPAALRAYGALTTLAVDLVAPGGTLVQASCSSRVDTSSFLGIVNRAAERAGVTLVPLAQTAQPIDHPVGFADGAYLKALFARVER
jgi:23S rRNA (cytosine1962-C5)-methyltransferase